MHHIGHICEVRPHYIGLVSYQQDHNCKVGNLENCNTHQSIDRISLLQTPVDIDKPQSMDYID